MSRGSNRKVTRCSDFRLSHILVFSLPRLFSDATNVQGQRREGSCGVGSRDLKMNVFRTCKQLSRLGQTTVSVLILLPLVLVVCLDHLLHNIIWWLSVRSMYMWRTPKICLNFIMYMGTISSPIFWFDFLLQQTLQQGLIGSLIRLQSTQAQTLVRD